MLQPGKSQTISFTINPADLASYETDISSWVAEAGKYTVNIGASSSDIKQRASFNLSKELIVEKDQKAMAPQVNINELKPTSNRELNSYYQSPAIRNIHVPEAGDVF